MTKELDITQKMILEQLHECTGRDICDSGGSNGRHWQRNQNKTWEDLANDPVKVEAFVYSHKGSNTLELLGYVKVAAYMAANLTYRQDLQDAFDKWVVDNEETTKDMYDYEQIGNFAAQYKTEDRSKPQFTYTYNHDNCLSQDIQFIEFEWEDAEGYEVKAAFVAVHQGADARGGMGSYKAYEVDYDCYLGDCKIDAWGCDSQQWDECGVNQGYPVQGPSLFDMEVHEFHYASTLVADLEGLVLTNLDTPERRAAMVEQDKINTREAFEEFCADIDDYAIVVYNHKAYFAGIDGPEEIYGDSFSLNH